MAFILADRVRESTTTTGTGAITLGGVPSASYQSFAATMSIGDTCWYCIVLPGSAWETGTGTYSALNTLTRTSVIASSNANAAVSFGAGTKDVFMCQPALPSKPFPTGTLMLFQQTAAPIYWTKQVTHNDKALRVVSGSASSGGASAFSAVLNSTISANNTTITQSTMASHTHSYSHATFPGSGSIQSGSGIGETDVPTATSSIGGDVAHTHSLTLNVAYVDLIIAQKD